LEFSFEYSQGIFWKDSRNVLTKHYRLSRFIKPAVNINKEKWLFTYDGLSFKNLFHEKEEIEMFSVPKENNPARKKSITIGHSTICNGQDKNSIWVKIKMYTAESVVYFIHCLSM